MAEANGGVQNMNNNNNNVSNSLIYRWNGRPYSQRYYEILEKGKTLPVWHQKDEFLRALKDNQTLILVVETGSGKTTQRVRCTMAENTIKRKVAWRVQLTESIKRLLARGKAQKMKAQSNQSGVDTPVTSPTPSLNKLS